MPNLLWKGYVVT